MLRRGYEEFGSTGPEAVLDLLHPDLTVEVHTERPDIGSEVYRGRAGFLANFAEMTDVFDDMKVEPHEVTQRGHRIMVACRVSGRGKESGVEIDAKIFHLWTLHDGLATKLEIFSDSRQAETAFVVDA